MKDVTFDDEFNEEESAIDLKNLVLKYLRYWPWFLVSTFFIGVLGFTYVQYAAETYQTVAKIKILEDEKESKIIPDPLSLMSANSTINLENHIQVLKSYRLLNNIVTDLHLDVSYFELGILEDTQIWNPPFIVTKNIPDDVLRSPKLFEVTLGVMGFKIIDENEKQYLIPFLNANKSNSNLPFNIVRAANRNIDDYKDIKFKVILHQSKQVTLNLINDLDVQASEKQSDILTLSLKGQSKERSEAILNAVIKKFNQDGILDRQLVSKRTLEVIDKRFVYLSGELDSIEVGKQNFKQANNLSYIEADAGMSLQQKAASESEVYKLETQVALSNLLKETVTNEAAYNLLPAEIGLSNSSLNSLVSNYNQMARERERLITSVGENHPTLQTLSNELEQTKLNILNTVNVYETQLGISLKQLNQQKSLAGSRFSRLPEKEKMLRSIERQQGIKENLFLMLLQKREEAAINYAVTAPSIKVIDYGLTDNRPLWPKKIIIFPMSLFMGMFIPFIFLYTKFSLNTKINGRSELEKINPEIPIIAEIPLLENDKKFVDANDRSILAESFRILSTNVNYMLPFNEKSKCQVVYVTSSIKGEGKTLLALNLSLAFASMEKRVLLVGADLRNPQLHSYFKIDKNSLGLSDFLSNTKLEFNECINEGFGTDFNHKVCLSGMVPPNAPVLLSSSRFVRFMEMAKKEFEYIIMDTSPTMLVTDTLLISKYADITLFAVRDGFTDKHLLGFSKGLNKSKKLRNMVYLLNAVGRGKNNDYNYGYGYGYDTQKPPDSWYKNFLKKAKK